MPAARSKNPPDINSARVRIVTCDPATERLEGVMKDGAIVQITVWGTASLFTWPQTGETWTIKRDGLYWTLDSFVEDESEEFPIGSMAPGESKLNSSTVFNRDGDEIIAIDTTSASPGDLVARTSDGWTTVAPSGGGGGTAITFTQVGAVNPWVITHNLGRYPVGLETFDTYGIKVEGDVVNTDNNTTTITFSGPMAGKATYI